MYLVFNISNSYLCVSIKLKHVRLYFLKILKILNRDQISASVQTKNLKDIT